MLMPIWIIAGALNYGATYAYFTNRFPSLDSPNERRGNAGFSAMFGLMGPLGAIPVLFGSRFYKYGFQWKGGPRNG